MSARKFAVTIFALVFFFGTANAFTRGGLTGPPPSGIQSPGPSAALFAAPYYTCSTNVFISPSGNDTTGNGTSGNPWQTFSKVNSTTPTAGTCVNAQIGTYTVGAVITHGGNLASSTGYVVYRCVTLNGCTVTDPGNQDCNSPNGGSHSAFFVNANYVMFDGFVFSSSSPQTEFSAAISSFACTGTIGHHHVWALNNIVSGYGETGIQFGEAEYFYAVHNTTHDNSANTSCNGGAQGSGIAVNLAQPTPTYTPTADDGNNPVTGNTGSLFRNFYTWNKSYNNRVAGCGVGGATDGNGIILDTLNNNCGHNNTGCTSGFTTYVNGTLIAFNVTYNNGGVGIHIFNSQYVTVANNSSFNEKIDPNSQGGTGGPAIDTLLSYGNTVINNIASAPCTFGGTWAQTAIGPNGPSGGNASGNYTTTLNGTINASVTSLTLAATTNMLNGSAGWVFSGSYALPGGNMILIGSEVMLVTAGWGTTSLTVQRGFYNTTAASHTTAATITWAPNYFSNNVSFATSPCSDVQGPNDGNVYSSVLNKTAINPLWVDVGNTSDGSESAQPNGVNFALGGSSPAIGFGQTTTNGQSFLPAQAVDAGACSSTLGSCP